MSSTITKRRHVPQKSGRQPPQSAAVLARAKLANARAKRSNARAVRTQETNQLLRTYRMTVIRKCMTARQVELARWADDGGRQ